MSIAEVLGGLQDLTLHHLFQQKATEAPVEERPHILPVQNILFGSTLEMNEALVVAMRTTSECYDL